MRDKLGKRKRDRENGRDLPHFFGGMIAVFRALKMLRFLVIWARLLLASCVLVHEEWLKTEERKGGGSLDWTLGTEEKKKVTTVFLGESRVSVVKNATPP